MKKTAMNELIEEIENDLCLTITSIDANLKQAAEYAIKKVVAVIIEQAKSKLTTEKEQLIEAYEFGQKSNYIGNGITQKRAENYYTQTYGYQVYIAKRN